jgi:hypothetical protein
VLIEEDCDRYRVVLNKIQKVGDNVLFAKDVTRLDYFLLIELLSLAGGSSRVDLQACKLGTGRRFTTS